MATNGSQQRTPRDSGASGKGSARVSPVVYRRRRLVALAVMLLVLLALLWGVSSVVGAFTGSDEQSGQAQQSARPAAPTAPTVDPSNKFEDFTPRPTPSASGGSGSATPSASNPSAKECGADLQVTAATDKDSYSAEQEPMLIMTVENTGEDPCRVNVGTKAMAFVVDSGAGPVFDSRHCAAPGEDRTVTLGPGKDEEARLPWDRVRTVEGCPTGQPDADPGYYTLTVSLGDQVGAGVPFTLEGSQ